MLLYAQTIKSVIVDTISQLLVLASSVEADAENRVHACNILRALYRDTRLGDSVAAFVEGGLRVAIQGFEAADWAERNAATLLFSALVTRIFGVKREKDALSSKNCLTGKVFFQRYPSLHGFLLEKLKESTPETGALLPPTASAGTLQLYPALYPILLILSRIFPSPSDAVNNPFQLAAFVGPVAVCAARYVAVAGHRPDRPATKFMEDNKEMEVWLAPVGKSRATIPFRISVATMVGTAVIEAMELDITPAETSASR